jgi:hypothetical protein
MGELTVRMKRSALCQTAIVLYRVWNEETSVVLAFILQEAEARRTWQLVLRFVLDVHKTVRK